MGRAVNAFVVAMKLGSSPGWNVRCAVVIFPILMWPALLSAGLAPVPSASQPRDEALSGQVLHRQIEEDWLKQAKAIEDGVATAVSTETDARGGCDGIKDGKYAFHTGQEPNPWWQMDLGEVVPLSRVVVFNRLD